MNKDRVLNALSLLAKAYAFAKDGQAVPAGQLLVEAAEDGDLDEVMDGVAQGAEALEDGADDYEDLPDSDEDEEDGAEDHEVMEANVKLPESVARLVARTMI